MTNVLSGAAVVFDFAIDGVADVVSTITDQPLILLFVVGIPLCTIAVGLTKRLLRF